MDAPVTAPAKPPGAMISMPATGDRRQGRTERPDDGEFSDHFAGSAGAAKNMAHLPGDAGIFDRTPAVARDSIGRNDAMGPASNAPEAGMPVRFRSSDDHPAPVVDRKFDPALDIGPPIGAVPKEDGPFPSLSEPAGLWPPLDDAASSLGFGLAANGQSGGAIATVTPGPHPHSGDGTTRAVPVDALLRPMSGKEPLRPDPPPRAGASPDPAGRGGRAATEARHGHAAMRVTGSPGVVLSEQGGDTDHASHPAGQRSGDAERPMPDIAVHARHSRTPESEPNDMRRPGAAPGRAISPGPHHQARMRQDMTPVSETWGNRFAPEADLSTALADPEVRQTGASRLDVTAPASPGPTASRAVQMKMAAIPGLPLEGTGPPADSAIIVRRTGTVPDAPPGAPPAAASAPTQIPASVGGSKDWPAVAADRAEGIVPTPMRGAEPGARPAPNSGARPDTYALATGATDDAPPPDIHPGKARDRGPERTGMADPSERLAPPRAAGRPSGVEKPATKAVARWSAGPIPPSQAMEVGLEQAFPGDAATLAPSSASGSAAPSASTSGTPGAALSQQIAQHIAANLPKPVTDLGTGTLEITLDPPELGRVRMSLVEIAGTITLSIVADRPETAELMRRHLDILAQEFGRSGLDAPSVRLGTGGENPGGEAMGRHGTARDPDAASVHGAPDAPPADPSATAHARALPPGTARALDLRL
jgi:flagellar hook-length control protein FliK